MRENHIEITSKNYTLLGSNKAEPVNKESKGSRGLDCGRERDLQRFAEPGSSAAFLGINKVGVCQQLHGFDPVIPGSLMVEVCDPSFRE